MKGLEKSRTRRKAVSKNRVNHKAKGTPNGKRASTSNSTKRKLVVEMRGGEPYEYYPLGKYVVAAPGVCGGRPTFKYTRVEVVPVLDAIAGGWSVKKTVDFYQRPELTPAALREAMRIEW